MSDKSVFGFGGLERPGCLIPLALVLALIGYVHNWCEGVYDPPPSWADRRHCETAAWDAIRDGAIEAVRLSDLQRVDKVDLYTWAAREKKWSAIHERWSRVSAYALAERHRAQDAYLDVNDPDDAEYDPPGAAAWQREIQAWKQAGDAIRRARNSAAGIQGTATALAYGVGATVAEARNAVHNSAGSGDAIAKREAALALRDATENQRQEGARLLNHSRQYEEAIRTSFAVIRRLSNECRIQHGQVIEVEDYGNFRQGGDADADTKQGRSGRNSKPE